MQHRRGTSGDDGGRGDGQHEARMQEFTAIYRRTIRLTPDRREVDELIADGMTVEMLPALGRLVDHALTSRVGDNWEAAEMLRWDTANLLLSLACRFTVWRRVTDAQMYGWLTVVASAPPDEAVDTAATVASLGRGLEAGSRMAAWFTLPDEVAPLAWAAGLSIEEASERHQAGTLTMDELSVLAGLRGYRFPESPA